MGITTKNQAIKMVNDFANSPAPINNQRRVNMARAIVELAIDSLRERPNLDWLRDLAKQEYERLVKGAQNGQAGMRDKHNQKILLWHKIAEVMDRKKYLIVKI